MLITDNLTVRFGGIIALEDVSIAVCAGQLVGLIGPNGAGKTTFIDAITGVVPLTRGSIRLDELDLTRLAPHDRARGGVARTWQGAELFADLTVAENVRVAAEPRVMPRGLWSGRRGAAALDERVRTSLSRIGIENLAPCYPAELSVGTQKLVGLARALAAAPKVLLLDEPAAGLGPSETADLASRLRVIVDSGDAVVLVDHDMGLMFSVCDHIYVLDFGKLIASGTPDEIKANDKVLSAYLGTVQPVTSD